MVAGRSARFAASFARIGLAPDTGLSWSLPQRVGRSVARRMVLTASTVDADDALSCGLVDELVDDGKALDRAVDVAEELAGLSAPMVAGLRRILAQPDQSLDAVLETEGAVQVDLFGTPEFAEGRTAFLERRAPDFAGPGAAAEGTASQGQP